MAADMIDVRYTGNQDPRSSTGAIFFGDRPDLKIGDVGKVYPEEFQRLVGSGHILETVELDKLKPEDLQEIASVRGLVVEGTGRGGQVTKKDLVEAVAPESPAEETSAETKS